MSKKVILIILNLLMVFSLASCAPSVEKERFFAMDTYMEVTIYSDQNGKSMEAVKDEIHSLEDLFSPTLPDSDVYRINHRTENPVIVSEDTANLLEQALTVCEQTDGALDISVYPYVRLWGFEDKNYAVPEESSLRALDPKVDYHLIQLEGNTVALDNQATLTLGAVAKGYTSDKCAALLKESGIKSALLSLGGNVQVIGRKPNGKKWAVGLEDPCGNGIYTAVEAEDCAIITSGSYQRYFEKAGVRYHHIIDPKTGKPAENELLSVTVIMPSGTTADCLSTALFVMGKDGALAYWKQHRGFEMVLVCKDSQVYLTEGIQELPSARLDSYTYNIVKRD